jgi:hypothetical protein
MIRTTLVFGTLRPCGDHFHVQYNCLRCGAPQDFEENRTLGKSSCDIPGYEFIVVAPLRIRQEGMYESNSICTVPSIDRTFLEKVLARRQWAPIKPILVGDALRLAQIHNSGECNG